MRAVLFDLGNTLVSYYAAPDFAPILRKCLRGCVRVLAPTTFLEEDELLKRALTLSVERTDYAVWDWLFAGCLVAHCLRRSSPRPPNRHLLSFNSYHMRCRRRTQCAKAGSNVRYEPLLHAVQIRRAA